jgi:hypothetical protein
MNVKEIAFQNTVMDSMACQMDCRGKIKVSVVTLMVALQDIEKSLEYGRQANIQITGQLRLFRQNNRPQSTPLKAA